MNNRQQKTHGVGLAVALGLCIAPSVHAQSTSQAGWASEPWKFEVTPYIWASGVSGTTRTDPRLPTADVDVSFSDLADKLDLGLMGTFEARKGRWGVLFDLFYAELSAESSPLLGGALGTAEVDLTQNISQLAGTYRVSNNPTTPVDVVVGARYASVDVDLNLSASALVPAGAARSRKESWTDGFVGVRIGHKLSDKWMLVGYADIGGGDTDKSWQAMAGVNYNFSDTMTGKFGYRILSMDYNEPELLYNIKTSGAYVGLGIKF